MVVFMKDIWFLIKKTFFYSNKKNLISMIFLFIISACLVYSTPWFFSKAIDALQTNMSFKRFSFFMLVILFAQLIHIAIRHIARIKKNKERFNVRKNFLMQIYHHVINLGVVWHKNNHSGGVTHIINVAESGLDNFTKNVDSVINILFSLLIPMVYLFSINYKVAIIFVLWTWVGFLYVFKINKKLSMLWGTQHNKNKDVSKTLIDYISNIRTILSLRLGARTQRNLEKLKNAVFPLVVSSAKTNEKKWSFLVSSFLILNNLILIYFVYVSLKSGNVFDFGTLVALKSYLSMAANGFFDFADKYDDILDEAIAVKQSNYIFDAKMEDTTVPRNLSAVKSFSISNLFFQHEDSNKSNLEIKDIIFQANKGEKIALVGESGAGKSTFLMLLSNLLKPLHVDLIFNNRKFSNLSPIGHRSTLIPQDSEFFQDTIEYNLCVGKNYSEKDIDEALRISRFDTVLDKLPKGLKSTLDEEGVNLSGGEKQRLALARGLLAASNYDIILLDEITSSVDSGNEKIIFERLFKKFDKQILITSVHKMNLLPDFDKIYVFKNRKIVQCGTFKKLCRTDGLFKRMWNKFSEK